MLKYFKIKNFKSFKDEVLFTLQSAPKQKTIEDFYYKELGTLKTKEKVLNASMITGPNASGKTNVLIAMMYYKTLVEQAQAFLIQGRKLPFEPFLFDSKTRQSTTDIEVSFLQDDLEIIHQISINGFTNTIESEALKYKQIGSKAEFTTIFDRNNKEDLVVNINFGNKEKFEVPNVKNQPIISLLSIYKGKSIYVNSYFIALSKLNFFRLNDLMEAIQETSFLVEKDEKLRKLIAKIINYSDMGEYELLIRRQKTQGIRIQVEQGNFENITSKPAVGDMLMPEFIKKLDSGERINVFNLSSLGTQFLYGQLGIFLKALMNGEVLLIDELGASIHPSVLNVIIRLFNDNEINTKNAQLIFTSHNYYLLEQDILRKDQIWFTEKENDISTIYSLAEFKDIRSTTSIKKQYFEGQFGALPNVEFDEIFDMVKGII